MLPLTLPDLTWQNLYAFLKTYGGLYVGEEAHTRRFVEAVLWITRSGAQWRLLPKDYGAWNSVYKRYARWCDCGVWQAAFAHVATDADLEWRVLDSTVIRAHPCAAGAAKKNGGPAQQALGRSVGGFSTKIHIVTDALGLPLNFILTGGQRHDSSQAPALLGAQPSDFVIADKGYDFVAIRAQIEALGAIPVIPERSNRKSPLWYDRSLYKERHVIECFINKLKQYRHIFSRFDKLASRYLGFLYFVSTLIWLR
jgi:transposase